MLIANLASGQIAIRFGAKGPNTCIVTACATGAHCIGDAYRAIQYGDADAIIAGGTEANITSSDHWWIQCHESPFDPKRRAREGLSAL